MGILSGKNKDSKSSSDRDADYRAPSDTGSSDQPDVVAGADKDAVAASPGLRDGATTNTTTDSVVNKGAVETQSPSDLDKRSPEERLEKLRGWGRQHRMRGPMDADWEEFEKLVGDGRDVESARRAT